MLNPTWALGVSRTDPHYIEVLTANGEHRVFDIHGLCTEGIPTLPTSKRLVYEGDFSAWSVGSAHIYLAGLGMDIPSGCENRHEIFTLKAENGTTVHIPALLLMRAFFKPNELLFPAVFTPTGIDRLSFVDYSEDPPTVVVDDLPCARRLGKTVAGVTQDRALRWLQLSKSAKRTAHSAYQNALLGKLDLSLPLGQVRIAFHGRSKDKHLYATKAALVAITIPKHDSLRGSSEEIIFHSMADSNRTPAASIKGMAVPLHPNGEVKVTQSEWDCIEPILKGKKPKQALHSQREVLNLVLYKLASGLSWERVAKGDIAVTDLTSAFRRWATTGRFEKVLAQLAALRTPEATTSMSA